MNTPRGAEATVTNGPRTLDQEQVSTHHLLELRNLSVTLGGKDRPGVLVRDVDLDLARGETLGIVGESGSGKSLTARAIAGLLPAGLRTHGSITYDGLQLSGATEQTWRTIRASRISLLLQDPFTILNPLQSVGTHLAESLPKAVRRERGRVRDETTARLDEVGLDAEVAQRYPFQLSGGMRQRVALAAALAQAPELLIADEPTTALDVTTQDEVLGLLRHIQRQRGMSLIFITHDLRVAFSVCDRIQVMYAGSVVEQAPAEQLVTAPAHPYSLGLLLAEPPVTHYVERLVSIPGRVPEADAVADRCAFADRCTWMRPKCVTTRPALAAIEPRRTSACIRLDDIRDELTHETPQFAPSGVEARYAPDGNPVATLTEVCKTYRSTRLTGRTQATTVLDRVSFTIGAGESLGLVGETGSGKTTIARCILGLTTPDSGSINLTGIEAANYRRLTRAHRRQVRRFVQVVFQDPYASLNPALSVGSTLREVLEQRGDAPDPQREISDLLTRVGLPEAYATRRPAALSGGEQQRIAIARAIAMRPKLLICDEPVAALDVSAQAQVLELLRNIQRAEGMSLLFITHDLSVVRQMADRVIVLYHGHLVESGATATVLDTPQHPYTQRLRSAVPDPLPTTTRHTSQTPPEGTES